MNALADVQDFTQLRGKSSLLRRLLSLLMVIFSSPKGNQGDGRQRSVACKSRWASAA
jgi:hypothetical protein